MKVELELPDKPEVHYIAGVVGLDPAAVVGHLIKVWAWFDKHTDNGHAHGVTLAFLDRLTNVTGFGEAMSFAGWIEAQGKDLIMPKFDRHNGESAKKRALGQRRKSRERHAKSHADGVTKTRPEKRREEVIHIASAGKKTSLPKGFCISDRVMAWAAEKGHTNLQAHFDALVSYAKRKGATYVDWDEALMEAVRKNWGKVEERRLAI